jgi:hypothetical protein
MKTPLALLAAACLGATAFAQGTKPAPPPATRPLDAIAESYVKLILAAGQHDADLVDAYYGPAEWKAEAETTPRMLPELQAWAQQLAGSLESIDAATLPDPERARHRFLAVQVRAARARLDFLSGHMMSCAEECALVYDTALPEPDPARIAAVRDRLEELLPGDGPLADRYEEYVARFVVPPEKVEAVMKAAIAESRRRTRKHFALPDDEEFQLEPVTGPTWSAYLWYKGNSRSVIQINTDLPFRIAQAFGFAAHEGYPGHHVRALLLEQQLVHSRGWREFEIYPLFSPRSVIEEGAAVFAVELVFPSDVQVRFAREILFPLVGLDPAEAAGSIEVAWLVSNDLRPVFVAIQRDYLDGRIDAAETERRLHAEALSTKAEAGKRISFIQRYRAYFVTYLAGDALVRDFVERHGGTPDQPERRWQVFADLLASPVTPSALAGQSPTTLP